ncbi:DUF1127 domain-containing protein [Rhodobacteraceae bacterium ASV31]|nr:DUF1127 domain-containing protein [Anianabacter salinae]
MVRPARNRQSVLAYLGAALHTYRQRRALARLDDAALRDIGLSQAEAATESSRPIWDVPGYWR